MKEEDLIDMEKELKKNNLIKSMQKKHKPPVNLDKYFNKIKLTEDPLEYQKKIRSEWE